MWIKGNRAYSEVSNSEFKRWDPFEKAYFRSVKEGERMEDKKKLINEILESSKSIYFLRFSDLYGAEEAKNLREYITVFDLILETKEEINQLEKEDKRKNKLKRIKKELADLTSEHGNIDTESFSDYTEMIHDYLVQKRQG